MATIPQELMQDRYWKALLHLFWHCERLNPLLNTDYFDVKNRVVHTTKLKAATKGWSQSEKFMMELALHLFNERNKINNLSDMDYLDADNKEIALTAIKYRFNID